MKPIILILILFVISNHGFGQGKLDNAERSLSNKGKRSSTKITYSYDDDLAFIDLLIGIAEVTVYVYDIIIETPHEAENSPSSNASITKYPYHSAKKGNYSYDWGNDTEIFRTIVTNRVIIENNQLYGNHLNADFRFLKRVGVEADYLQLWEDKTFFRANSLALFTVLAKYHRARTERFDAYWGMGATYIAGDVEELGFTYGIGAEYFFARPLSVEANFNQTFINSRSVDKVNVLLNYHMNQFKATGGYEYLRIGGVDFSTFSVGLGIFI